MKVRRVLTMSGMALAAALVCVPMVYAAQTDTTIGTRVRSGVQKMFHRGEDRGPGMGDNTKMLEEQATILGITVDDLKSRLESGKKIEDIATDLRISSDTLKTKMEEARTAREATMKAEMTAKIQQEVTDGKITQAEADTKIANLENMKGFQGGKGFGMMGEGRGMGMGAGIVTDSKCLEEQATILGITVDDLKSRLESGKKIEDIATDLRISSDTLKTKMEEARTARQAEMKTEMTAKIAQDVTDGKMTQEQADKMLERLENPGEHGPGMGGGKGAGGSGRGFGMHRGESEQPSQE